MPEDAHGSLLEAEHEARYRWAAEMVRDREVLDAGCGVGYGTAAIAAAGARRAVGLDISEAAVLDARDRFGSVGEFVVGDVHELPFGDGSFDVVVCFGTVVRASDPKRALDELRRVLRPEGLLLLSVPNAAVYPAGNPFHLHEYLPDELAKALTRRFVNLRLYRQQSHVASLVCDDGTFAEPAPEQDLSARVRKLARGRPGEELYTIAAASDTSLPDMSTLALIGGAFEERSWHDLAWSLRERVLIAEAEASASDADAHAARLETARSFELLRRAEEGRREAEALLGALRNSLSWRMTRPLRVGRLLLRRGRAAYRALVPKRSRT
ncbi:MAG: class I SAM-dependent methyltransferase [Actinomycetota bacterium]|nr:class I SAM-dependent methyltransferase [Actinomycetota bacterium]